ncbi:MAG: SMC-Scp complex subunit ScpB [Azospirillaceae bacterium]|nr:SMC-Scp complex subunit ScpB [Azospirillaceae bacterium]
MAPVTPGTVSPERLAEALIFAAVEPISRQDLALRLGPDVDVATVIAALTARYADGGINLFEFNGRLAFRTALDLAPALRVETEVARKLSRAAIETLAIIAYHQPVTRTEIEGIRGVATSKGTLDLLLEAGWIGPGRRRETPGRPLTWITTDHFLNYFSLSSLRDLPGVEELRAAGLLESRPVLGSIPMGNDDGVPAEPDGETEGE